MTLLAKELRALAFSNLQQKERHQTEAGKKLSAGIASDYDLLAAQVAVDNARPELIRSENRIRSAKERLRLVLAWNGGEIEVAGSLESVPVSLPPFEESLATARRMRPELSGIRHQVGIYQELVQIASADTKPQLDLKGGAGWHQLEAGGRTWEGPAWDIDVYRRFPFFDGFRTKGKVQQAKSDLRTRELEQAQQLDAVSLEVRNAGFGVQPPAAAAPVGGNRHKERSCLLPRSESKLWHLRSNEDPQPAQHQRDPAASADFLPI